MDIKNNYQVKLDLALDKFKKTRYSEALIDFKNLSKKLNHFLVYWYLGHTANRLNDYKSAINFVLKSINLKSKDTINLNFLGELYRQTNQNNQAIETFEEGLKIDPNNQTILKNLASIYVDMGKFTKAISIYEELLKIESTDYHSIYQLIKLDKSYLTIELETKTNILIKNNHLNDTDLQFANFVLAEFAKEKKNYTSEVLKLLNGHSLFLANKKKALDEEYNYFTNLLPEFIKKIKKDKFTLNTEATPIFIMGLPRSGTTLVENIILSGSKDYASGEETGVMGKVFFRNQIIQDYASQKLISKFEHKEKDYYLLRDEISKQYDQIGVDIYNKNFTDKSLENLLYIDLIHKIFPKARFIYCKRNLNANFIGILKVFLPNLLWTHSQEKILKFFNIYEEKLKEILNEKKIKIKIIEIEQLTSDPENISKDLFDFLNFSWSQECLNLDTSENKIIKTVSNTQVRGKIKSHNLEYLNNYNFFLKKNKLI